MNSRTENVQGTLVTIVPQSDGSEDVLARVNGQITNLGYVLPNIAEGTWDVAKNKSTGRKYHYGYTWSDAIAILLGLDMVISEDENDNAGCKICDGPVYSNGHCYVHFTNS